MLVKSETLLGKLNGKYLSKFLLPIERDNRTFIAQLKRHVLIKPIIKIL